MRLLATSRNKNLKRDPKSGVYYWRQYADGREFFKSTGESRSEARAEQIGRRMFAEWLGKPEAMKRATFFFEDVSRMYLETKVNMRKSTIVSARLHVNKHLVPYFGGFMIDRAPDYWEGYISYKRQLSPGRKFYNDAKHFKSIIKLAYEKGLVQRPFNARNPDAKTTAGKEFTDKEISALLGAADGDLSLQIRMALLMGMRYSEILRLSWDRIDLGVGLIHLTGDDTKTKLPRQVPIHTEIWAELKLRKQSGGSPFVFPSPGNPARPVESNDTAWRNCKAKAGVIGRFHDLRHSAVTRMLFRYKIPATQVAAIVGMSLAVMQRYSHPKGAYLHEAMDKVAGTSGITDVQPGTNGNNNENTTLQ